jgi:hypothetical protein
VTDQRTDERTVQDSAHQDVRDAVQETADKARRMLANPRRTRR